MAKKGRQITRYFPSFFVVGSGSGIRDPESGMEKKSGSATLQKSFNHPPILLRMCNSKSGRSENAKICGLRLCLL
jgi:hypothetical protein